MERWTEEPAFPAEEWLNSDDPRCVNPVRHSGMSLRDYFAAQALEGIEASQGNNGHYVSTVDKVAARAYELADAMLRARAGYNIQQDASRSKRLLAARIQTSPTAAE